MDVAVIKYEVLSHNVDCSQCNNCYKSLTLHMCDVKQKVGCLNRGTCILVILKFRDSFSGHVFAV